MIIPAGFPSPRRRLASHLAHRQRPRSQPRDVHGQRDGTGNGTRRPRLFPQIDSPRATKTLALPSLERIGDAALEFVSDPSSEGNQFVKGFNGIGAMLRYKLNFEQLAVVDSEDEFYNARRFELAESEHAGPDVPLKKYSTALCGGRVEAVDGGSVRAGDWAHGPDCEAALGRLEGTSIATVAQQIIQS